MSMTHNYFTTAISLILLMALPQSGNFQLNSYGFGTGGTAGSSSSNYSINGLAGEAAGSSSSGNYTIGAGENYVKQANVPTVSIANGGNWYNKLQITLDPASNPDDAQFLIAISKDNFVTTLYVQPDLTIGASQTLVNYRTYAAWGSSAGFTVRGLMPSTVYSVKSKAYRGAFTESGYGPVASAATVDPQLAFSINVSAANVASPPPFIADFGTLLADTVTSTNQPVWVNFASNAESGGNVYIRGQNAGLKSAGANYTIAALTGNLLAQPEGFGAQVASSGQSSGSQFSASSPYSTGGDNVGPVDLAYRVLFEADGPTSGGVGSVALKAKSRAVTPAAGDYAEILTFVAAANF